MSATYTVRTWDTEKQDYTPQEGLEAENVDLWTMKRVLKSLRELGYSAHRRRDADGAHEDNDAAVMVCRTDDEFLERVRKEFEQFTASFVKEFNKYEP